MLIRLGREIDIFRSYTKVEAMPSSNYQLDLIEFIFYYVSKPIKYEIDEYFKVSYVAKFDAIKGKYAYTVCVNEILQRNRIAFKLEKGQIIRTHMRFLTLDFKMKISQ